MYPVMFMGNKRNNMWYAYLKDVKLLQFSTGIVMTQNTQLMAFTEGNIYDKNNKTSYKDHGDISLT